MIENEEEDDHTFQQSVIFKEKAQNVTKQGISVLDELIIRDNKSLFILAD